MATTKINDFLSNLNSVEDTSGQVPFTVAAPKATHKLTFLAVRARNFRSVGDNFMELDLTKDQSTLIVSDDNGSGKSTMSVWALYYALTGKAYGDKEKVTSLVNTTNRTNMVVEAEFLKSGSHFKIIRGRKPDIFEIHYKTEDGFKVIDSDAAKADWQGYLWGLLGMDAKTGPKLIENVIILGKDKFLPFIEMGAEDRRKMVEPIWDLGIFRDLNEQLKEERRITNGNLESAIVEHREAEHKVELFQGQIEALNTTVRANEHLHNQNIAVYERDLKESLENRDKAHEASEGVVKSLEGFKHECDARILSAETRLNDHVASIDTRIRESTATVSADLVSKKDALSAEDQRHKEALADIVDRRKRSLDEQENNLQSNSEEMAEIEKLIAEANDELLEVVEGGGVEKIEKDMESLNAKTSSINENIQSMNNHRTTFQTKLSGMTTELDKLNELGDCPTCHQHVGDEHKQSIADKLQPSIEEMKANSEKADTALANFKKQLSEVSVEITTLQEALRKQRITEQEITARISGLKSDLANLKKNRAAIEQLMERIKEENRAEYKKEEERVTNTRSKLHLEIQALEAKVGSVEEERMAELTAKTTELELELAKEKEVYDRRLEEERFKASETLGYWDEQVESCDNAVDKAKAGAEECKKEDASKVEEANIKLTQLQQSVTSKSEIVDKLTADLEQWDALKLLLSDKEGKADIIRKYMPFLNSKINEYLESMNMFIGFEMDEAFNAKMNAPDRANQTLFSLSSGQRARVNMAIVFALRDVANLKASIQTNLLVLDEVLENLSERGVLEATTMIKEKFASSNLFVISQRAEEFQEHFHTMIKYGLRGGYTEVLERT